MKKKLYASLNVNQYFWKLAKTNFSNKIITNNRVTLWSGKIISDTEQVSKFQNLNKPFLVESNKEVDSVLKATRR